MSTWFDERAIKQVANDAMKRVARDAQPLLDGVHRSHAGKPVGEVLLRLRSARWTSWRPTDTQLRHYAEEISKGNRVILKP